VAQSTRDVALRGAHNHSNVAAGVAAVTAVLGERVLDYSEELAQVLKNFESLPHRLGGRWPIWWSHIRER
jgi:UDP-N-acetylmuramoylalanine-D-glutamate ligase